jgi:hypothetical protein
LPSKKTAMCKNVETIRIIKVYDKDLPGLQQLNAQSNISKKIWVQKYSYRMLKLWLQRQSPLGIARTYIEQIEKDLAEYYDEPLKRIFIETTYR